jgi:hypothetical protein
MANGVSRLVRPRREGKARLIDIFDFFGFVLSPNTAYDCKMLNLNLSA